MSSTLLDLSRWLTLRAWSEPPILRRGGPGRLVVEVDIPADGHIEAHEPPEPFLVPTVLSMEPMEGGAFGPVHYPPAEVRRFDWSPVALMIYRNTIRLAVPVQIAPDAPEGRHLIRGALHYQGCAGGVCLRPATQSVEVVGTVPQLP